jgi:hypothetical protein
VAQCAPRAGASDGHSRLLVAPRTVALWVGTGFALVNLGHKSGSEDMAKKFKLGTIGALSVAALLCGLSVAACGDADDGGTPGASGEHSSAGQAGEPDATAGTTATGGGQGGAGGELTLGGGGVSAGAAGAGGGDGMGGVDSSAVVGRDCNDEAFTLEEEHVRYCTVLASCSSVSLGRCLVAPRSPSEYWFFSSNGGQTVSGVAPQLDDRTPLCPATIATCEDVFACTGARSAAEECDANAEARCDGELAINCGNHPELLDCERLTGKAGTCTLTGGVAGCEVKSDCDTAGEQGCDGDVAFECGAGAIGFGRDCAALGMKCVEEHGRAFCAEAPVGTCDAVGTAYCEGDQRAFCNSEGELFEAPACGGAGDLTCAIAVGNENVGDYAVDCVPAGCGNAWGGLTEDCEGDDYVAREGYWNSLRIHCPAFGFATCRDGRCTD